MAMASATPVRAAAPPPPDFGATATTSSQTGQFVVQGPRLPRGRALTPRRGPDAVREINPQTLAVSCDRIKSEILKWLDAPDVWRAGGGRIGKIYVQIDATIRTNTAPSVAARSYENGWQYHVHVPKALAEDRLVRGIVQAVTMELASRRGNQRAGEPPLWLVEGLTQVVLASVPEGVILEPQTRTGADYRGTEPLDALRDQLTRRAPLAFHELGQPDFSRMGAAEWKHFSASAHLAVRELVRLPQGPTRFATWLGTMQQHWNWQTGFLESFSPPFRSLLDVEKWWALTVANFTGRNQASAWPPEFALRKLEETLQPIGVLPGAGSRPSRLSLENVLLTWDFPRQQPLLRQLLQQLNAIRIHSPPTLSPLAFRYLDLLEEYSQARSRIGFSPGFRGQPMASVKLVVREAVGRLRELEAERARLAAELAQPQANPAPESPPPGTPGT